MIEILAVGCGGFLGAVCRFLMGKLFLLRLAPPSHTLIINALGCLVMGIVVGCFGNNKTLLFTAVTVGFCGGFTTFSAFSLETLSLMEKGAYVAAAGYVGASVVLCVLGVWIGKTLDGFLGLC
ncbi:MAG: CrcB family protein [Abditibacteriota bacterium]|nr:CrcB family protein [Abditibacteriota bacterium]